MPPSGQVNSPLAPELHAPSNMVHEGRPAASQNMPYGSQGVNANFEGAHPVPCLEARDEKMSRVIQGYGEPSLANRHEASMVSLPLSPHPWHNLLLLVSRLFLHSPGRVCARAIRKRGAGLRLGNRWDEKDEPLPLFSYRQAKCVLKSPSQFVCIAVSQNKHRGHRLRSI
jgi:hypothetical protein